MLTSMLTTAMLLWGGVSSASEHPFHSPLYGRVSLDSYAMAANLAARDVDGASSPVRGPKRPAWFLPALEYAFPVGPIGERQGWSTVQHILKNNGADQLLITGRPDDETLRALLAYLQPLMHRLIDRARLAERRALHEERRRELSRALVRYGNWNQSPTEGHYSGEMYFPPEGDPSPIGYVRVSGSGWPIVSEYYRAGEELGSPLCSAAQFGTREKSFLFSCKLLDGDIRIAESNNASSITYLHKGEPVASFHGSGPNAPRRKILLNPPLHDNER